MAHTPWDILNFYVSLYILDAEHEAQQILWEAGLCCPQPVKNLEGNLKSLQKIMYRTSDEDELTEKCGNYHAS